MNLMIERAFIVALLLSISGFVFCAIFLPFEKIAYKWTSARTMVYVNTVALFSFVTPLYFVISLRDGSEKAFIQSDLLIHEDISGHGISRNHLVDRSYWLFRLLCMEICQPVICRKKVYVLCTG